MIDIRPRKASPILKRNTNPKIPKAILNPFFLKKLMIGPRTVPQSQPRIFVNRFEAPNLSSIGFAIIVIPLPIALTN